MRVAFWAAMGITTLVMIAGGVAKLTGHPVAHGVFADLGTPGWVVYAVGVCELAGAAGLWLRQTTVWAALGIAGIMLGAIYYHLSFPPLPAGLPALVVLLAAIFIVNRGGWDGVRRGSGKAA